jgi:hypothetical protein
MKPVSIFLVVPLICIQLFTSCKKHSEPDKNTNDLTSCPVNSDCTHTFSTIPEYALDQPSSFRAFTYGQILKESCNIETRMMIKAPLTNNQFDYNAQDIVNGAVNYNFICPCCNFILFKPIGGHVEGYRIDDQKWLIHATVILGPEVNKPMDTLTVNQYFVKK